MMRKQQQRQAMKMKMKMKMEMEMEMEEEEEEEEKMPMPMPSANVAVPPPTSSTSVEFWSAVPEVFLNSILTFPVFSNPDVADFLSFPSICRSWPSSSSSTSVTSSPPFLLQPQYKTLKTLTLKNFTSRLPPVTLALPSCVGYSNGNLIFANHEGSSLLINVFTGSFAIIPSPVPTAFLGFRLGFLTPSSNHLLLLDWDFGLLSYSPWTKSWSCLDLHHRITSISMFRGCVFGIDTFTRLILLDLDGERIGWKQMSEMPALPLRNCMPCSSLGQSLVECGEELLMLRFIIVEPYPFLRTQMLEVYRMDFGEAAWVEVNSIGDWCIFVDTVGTCPLACPDPERWGGRSNSVYIAGPRCEDGWVVVQLDGSRRVRFGREDVFSEELRDRDGYELNMKLPRWPSPIWVSPSMLSSYYK